MLPSRSSTKKWAELPPRRLLNPTPHLTLLMAGSVGSEDGDLGFQIAPMVDVVFVLLLFFMACAGSKVVEKELAINLPSGAKSTQGTAVTPLIIDISPDGQVSMNNDLYGNPSDKNLVSLKEK